MIISKTLGIEERKLLTPDDDYEPLNEFNRACEGTKTVVEEMHLEYQSLIQEDPELEDQLNNFPGAIFSGHKFPAKETRSVFFCYALHALDRDKGEFTKEAGITHWYLYKIDDEENLDEPSNIIESIRSKPSTPRSCTMEEKTLKEIRDNLRKRIKNTYLRSVNAPVQAKPVLRCWMEFNEG